MKQEYFIILENSKKPCLNRTARMMKNFICIGTNLWDGKWERMQQEPVLRPTAGWRKSHIYACDVRYRDAEKTWYMYYNARNGWPVSEGQERIGLLVGKEG